MIESDHVMPESGRQSGSGGDEDVLYAPVLRPRPWSYNVQEYSYKTTIPERRKTFDAKGVKAYKEAAGISKR